jgi:hypothetical protein
MHIYNPSVAAHPEDSLDAVLSRVLERCDPSGWALGAVATLATDPSFDAVAAPFAAAKRRLRGAAALATPEEVATAAALGADGLLRRGATAICRGLMLLTACRALSPEHRAGLVDRLFRTGDNGERVAVLSMLAFLPAPSEHAATAVEACRSNVRDVFEAIACENDFPARFFSDDAFNQMVMKALFSGVELARVRGLGLRINSELRRMAADYAAERTAAGRPVPRDLRFILDGLAA